VGGDDGNSFFTYIYSSTILQINYVGLLKKTSSGITYFAVWVLRTTGLSVVMRQLDDFVVIYVVRSQLYVNLLNFD